METCEKTSAGELCPRASATRRVFLPHLAVLMALSITARLDAGDWTRQRDGWQKTFTVANVGTHQTSFLACWLPEGIEKVKGVLVFANHQDSGGFMFRNAEARALARRTGLAMALLSVGSTFSSDARNSYNEETYSILEQLAESTVLDESVPDHPEIEYAPLLTWGWSATGTWAVHYANDAALAGQLDRCIFSTRYHSHFRSSAPRPVSPALYRIPGLMMIGGADGTAGSEALTWHGLGRRNGAPWTVCIEPGIRHGGSAVWAMSLNFQVPYFEAVINRRLTEASGSGGDWVSLNLFSEAEGWLGLNDFNTDRTFGVAPYAQYTLGPVDQATWLPTEEVALLWQAASKATYYGIVANAPRLTTSRPTCAITNLQEGATVDTAVMVDASAVDSDGVIARLYFFLDGRVVEKMTSPTQGSSYQYTFTGLPEGKHWLGVRAYDDKGLWGHQFLRVTVEEAAPVRFARGDCNDDGNVDISDAVCILKWLFAGEATPGCVAATNTNGDDDANIADATYLLHHLFSGGRAPAQPFPDCGTSELEADAGLGCETSCQ